MKYLQPQHTLLSTYIEQLVSSTLFIKFVMVLALITLLEVIWPMIISNSYTIFSTLVIYLAFFVITTTASIIFSYSGVYYSVCLFWNDFGTVIVYLVYYIIYVSLNISLVSVALTTKGLLSLVRSYSYSTTKDSESEEPFNGEALGNFNDNGTLIAITVTELKVLIEQAFVSAQELEVSKPSSPSQLLDFQKLFNGMFQAEGSWSGSFKSLGSLLYRPGCSITQNASTYSLSFFARLNVLYPGALRLSISINNVGNFKLDMRTNSWTAILNTIIPYLHMLQGDKYLGMIKLRALYKLQYSTNFAGALHTVWLAHNLSYATTSVSQVSLADKMLALYPSTVQYSIPDFTSLYPNTNHPM